MVESYHRACTCGTVYQRTESMASSREIASFECAVCGATLETWNTAWVPSYRLIAEPVRLRQLGREEVIMSHCVVVRTYGGKLDQLRGEAYRIARDNNIDWWAEAADTGTKFCFENAKAKASFGAACERENVQYT
jgi:hypothetical protein